MSESGTPTDNSRGFFQRYVSPRVVSAVCGCRLCGRQRMKVVPLAEGVVVEIGIGSGHNLPLYDPSRVTAVIGVDPDPVFTSLGASRIAEAQFPVEILTESAEAVSLDTVFADTVVTTYAFCTIPNAAEAMMEVRRILKPSGRLLFCEHGRSDSPRTAALQDRLNPWWKPLAGGCNINRNLVDIISGSGLIIEQCATYVPRFTPEVVGFHYVGSARLQG